MVTICGSIESICDYCRVTVRVRNMVRVRVSIRVRVNVRVGLGLLIVVYFCCKIL